MTDHIKLRAFLPFLLLAACSGQPDTPGAVTQGEAQALNDAAAMLDANSVDANAVIEDPEQADPQ